MRKTSRPASKSMSKMERRVGKVKKNNRKNLINSFFNFKV